MKIILRSFLDNIGNNIDNVLENSLCLITY